MHKTIGATATLVILFIFSGCGEYSPFSERHVKVYFSPAITVDQSIDYAHEHRAKIKSYEFKKTNFLETDSGFVVVNDDDFFHALNLSLNDMRPETYLEPDDLAKSITNDFARVKQLVLDEIQKKEELLPQYEAERKLILPSTGHISEVYIRTIIHEKEEELIQECLANSNKAKCFFGSPEIGQLESRLSAELELYNLITSLNDYYSAFSQLDSITYVETIRIESMVLRVKPYRSPDLRWPVVDIERYGYWYRTG